jgi:hypothetical protein
MQTTHPVTATSPIKAALLAVVVATIIVTGILAAAFMATSFAGRADQGTTVGTAPLVLDPDAREGAGRWGAGPNIAQ